MMEKLIARFTQFFNPQCQDESFLDPDQYVFRISPLVTVIQPWLGRHNVYGVFILPDEHQLAYPILLSVKGAGQYRKEANMVKINVDRDERVPSHCYVLRVHLRTRVTLLMMLRGLSDQLRDPKNWTLSYQTKTLKQK